MTDRTSRAQEDSEKQVHFILNNLHNPLKLAESKWASAQSVRHIMQQHPEWSPDQAVRTHFDALLQQLQQEENEYANLLRARFWENRSVNDMVTNQYPVAQSERRFYMQQKAAIARLTYLLLQVEEQARREMHTDHLLARLPLASYEQLFGVEALVEEVNDYLANADRHHILCIKGIGGIGKTALADQAIRTFVPRADSLRDLFWITAKQEYLTTAGIQGQVTQIQIEQLFDDLGQKLELPEVLRLPLAQKVEKMAAKLRTAPYLIVIDNLESIEDFQTLTPWLAQLARPAKFVLTGRQTLPSLQSVTTVPLGELGQDVALNFIHYTAHAKKAADVNAERLYNLVGGNPLAIVLAVSQLAIMPEHVVYDGVRLGNPPDIYTYIYGKAWSMLDDPARELLFAIQRAGDQADWDWLEMVCDMRGSSLRATIQQLLDLSLIQVQQDINSRRVYAIHRLTSTFLRTEVLAWQ